MGETWKQWLLTNGALALLLPALVVSTASADGEEVERRLGKYGKLSGGETRKVIVNVSGRMKRAADMTNDDDPLRSAVSQALYGGPAGKDAMKAAKVRLRLYAGLNEWALDNLFAARPGAVVACTQQFGLRKAECEALIAAAGKISIADASRLGAGQPIMASPAASGRPGYAQRPMQAAPAQQGRFGRFDSGYRGAGAQPMPMAVQPRPMPQQGYAARPMPVARPMPGARPMPAAQARPVMAPAPTAMTVAARKAEYERKRQEYLQRKREEMEARKNKVVAVAVGERIQRGPASAAEAEAAGLDPSEAVAPAPQPAPVASKSAAKAPKAGAPEQVAQAPAEEAPPSNEKPALDNSFLDGLMDDPLGKSK